MRIRYWSSDVCSSDLQESYERRSAMSATPRRVENLHTDKGKVPVYATGIVEQPWDDYSADDHATWATLYARQRKVLPGRASDEFLAAQDAMGMRSEEHTSALHSLMRISNAVFC